MARIPVPACGEELRVRMVGPDVRGLHADIPILAIGDRITREALHPCHLAHTPAGIFNEPVPWSQPHHEVDGMLVHFVTERCILTDRIQVPGHEVLPPVMAYGGDAERGTVRAHPYHIRTPEPIEDILHRDPTYVRIPVDALKIPRPVDAERLMPPCLKSLTDAPGACKQFQHSHLSVSPPPTSSKISMIGSPIAISQFATAWV